MRNMFMVNSKFMDGHIARQVIFVNAPEWLQEITQTGPASFAGIDIHFPNAIPIVITGPFILTMAHSVSDPFETIITV